jgi:hypothetical protein
VESEGRHRRALAPRCEVDERRVRFSWLVAPAIATLAVMCSCVPLAQANAATPTHENTLNTPNSAGDGKGATLNAHSGSAMATLAISVVSFTVTVGGTISPTVTISSGLAEGDTATITGTNFTYAGTGSTVYAKSTTVPTAIGTYSVNPSGSTVTISPSSDAGNYSNTYIYIAGTLTISPVVVKVVPNPHARRVVGDAIIGERRTLTILGSNFSANPSVTSNGPGALLHVYIKGASRIVLSVAVSKSSRPGSHVFTITTSAGKRCRIVYVTRYWH